MAKKKVKEEKVELSSDGLISDLISGTQFKFIDKKTEGNGSLSDKPKVKTPLHVLNCLLGGGLPLGAIIEAYGPNAAGKSSLMYETLGNFQKQYPNGVAFIVDSETSTDDSRLRQLGVNPDRAPRMGAATLEEGFEQINTIMRKMIDDDRYKGFPVFILWDTIAACPTRAQLESGEMYAGGMAERARIIKTSLTNMFPLIEKQNVLLVLLNQVMAEIGGWRPGITSAGGNALKHDVHLRIEIDGGKTEFDGVFATEKSSKLKLEKSKISPVMQGIPIKLDITKGGVINQSASLVEWFEKLDTEETKVFNFAAWSSVKDWAYNKYKPYFDRFPKLFPKFRRNDLYALAAEDENFVNLLQLIWLDLISNKYTLQAEVCKEYRAEINQKLMNNLGITIEELEATKELENNSQLEMVNDNTLEDLSNTLSNVFTHINPETGEVLE